MTSAPRRATPLFSGLSFGESPRWHDGAFWLSDFHRGVVERVDASGERRIVAALDDMPSGLGWLPDGRLLVVSKTKRRVMRLDPDGLKLHADLSAIATYYCNDMVVDGVGRAYVGNYGAAFAVDQPPTPAMLACVTPDGVARAVGAPLMFPNGAAITADGRTLLVAETLGNRISAFTIAPNGDLSEHRVWAALDSAPDGLCVDAEGCAWAALPYAGEVRRIREGGAIVERIAPTSDMPVACALGGTDRKTLYVITAPPADNLDAYKGTDQGRVETISVGVSGAGWP